MTFEVRPSRLASLGYVVARGFRGMVQSAHVQLLAVGTMAVCMLLLGAVTLAWQNAWAVSRDLGVDVPMTVYLTDDAPDEAVRDLAAAIEALSAVDRVVRVRPEDALDRLVHGLSGEAELLDGIDSDTLPQTLEVHLADGVPARVAPHLAARLSGHELVEDVEVAGPWAERAEAMVETLQRLAVGAGALVVLACATIVWSTIRLGVFARRAEVHILRLVGGTHAFVRGPFVVEGIVQATVAVVVALVVLHAAFDMVRPYLEDGLSLVFAAGSLRFFSPEEMAFGLGLGAIVGYLGARAAVARYVEV